MTLSAFGVEDTRISKATPEKWAQKKERSVRNQAALNAGAGAVGASSGLGLALGGGGYRGVPAGIRAAAEHHPKLLAGVAGVGAAYGAGVGAVSTKIRNKKIRESKELVATRQRQDSTV